MTREDMDQLLIIVKVTELELTCRRRAAEDYMVAPGWEWFADELRRILQGEK